MLLKILISSIFSLLFFLHFLHGFDIKVSSKEENLQVHLTTNLMKQCYPTVKSSYLITDSQENSLYMNFYTVVGTITLFEQSKNFTSNLKKKSPISSVIMSLRSSSKLEEALIDAKWRAFNQFFIILDGGDTNNGCDNAKSFLMEAWRNDILKAVFLCWNYQKQIPQLYSFNPFNRYAPMSWEKVAVVPAINGHPWTLFVQNYDTGIATCESLFFDRTSDLGRYIIKFGLFNLPPFLSYKNISGVATINGYNYEIIKLLVKELNATLVIDEVAAVLGRFDNATTRGLLWRVAKGKVDLTMNSLILRAVSKSAEITYPFHGAGLSAISQNRLSPGHDSQLFSFLPPSIFALLFITCILVFFLLLYLFKDPYSRNVVAIVLLLLNLPTPSTPITTNGRIIFGATLLGFTITNVIIQAKMDTVMSILNTEQNIENIEDINNLNYTVLTRRGILSQTLEANGVTNIKLVPHYISCSQLERHEAFVGVEYILRTHLTDTCHMSKHPIVPGLFVSYYTRSNWPIYPKINKKLLMLFEGDLTRYISDKVLREYYVPNFQEVERYQVITLQHMEYAFYFFVGSSLMSLIVFFVELVITIA
ncbi:Protein of unknown function [Cotesia congregata]|uniref:Uncharacterized protein n=1 Tax=Cotesia congregata TaxID=51543 RepID=A0A8J2H8H1_COTCN|nr:Protein of unknown function [Cotesia congregata]